MQQVSGRYLSAAATRCARWLSAAKCSFTYRMLLYVSMPCSHFRCHQEQRPMLTAPHDDVSAAIPHAG